MNVIIVSRNGILDNPILVKNDITAQVEFDNLAESLLGEDISEVRLHSGDQVIQANYLLKHKGIEIHWFENIEVNKYKNF